MLLTHSIITILLLSQTYTCLSMNQISEIALTQKEEKLRDKELNDQFYERWYCGIPNTVIKETINGKIYYKAVHHSYVKKNINKGTNIKIIAQDEVDSDTITQMEQLKKIKKEETENLNNPISTPTIDPLEAQVKKLELMEKKLQEENAQIKLNLEKNILKTITLVEKYPSIKIENEGIKEEIAAYKKLSSFEAKKSNNNNNINSQKPDLSKQNPHTNHAQQRLEALRFLFKKYSKEYRITIKTKIQLKNAFSRFCKNNDHCCLTGRINRYCTWGYCHANNELCIDTDDCESTEDSTLFNVL